jgi:MSHA biogenesis protein MshL
MREKLNWMLCGFLACTFLLSACSEHLRPNPGQNTTITAVNQALQNGYANNRRIAARKSMKHMPSQIRETLLPDLTVAKNNAKNLSGMKRFNVSVKDVPIKSFLMGLVKDTPYNIVIDPSITGTISLDLKAVSVEDVLNVLHDLYGYKYRRTNYGYEVLPHRLVTRIFTVDYLNIIRSGNSSTSISSGQISQKINGTGSSLSSTSGSSRRRGSTTTNTVQSSSVETTSASDFWKSLSTTLQSIVKPTNGREVIINPGAGTVIVRAYPDELEEIAHYLDSLESTMTRQVIIEAKILEVRLGKGFEMGIDWKVLATLVKNTAGEVTSKLELGQDATTKTFNTDDDSISPLTNNMFGGGIKGDNFDFFLKLLSTQGNVQVLSSPRVATLNNQKAVIKVGQDEFFITDVETDTTATGGIGTPVQTQDIEFTPFFSGIALDVTPQIAKNGEVLLHIHPIVSDVTEKRKKFRLGVASTSTTNGQTIPEQDIPLALSNIRETDTIVRAEDGQVVVIGGLIENKNREIIASTPGPDKIPLFGSLFRRTKQEAVRSELVILLKPVIVKNHTWKHQLKDAAARVRKLSEGYHFGPHPKYFGNLGENIEKLS